MPSYHARGEIGLGIGKKVPIATIKNVNFLMYLNVNAMKLLGIDGQLGIGRYNSDD